MADEMKFTTSAAELRRKAEEHVTSHLQSTGELEDKRLLHELQVQQIELMMQNEELNTAVTSLKREITDRKIIEESLRESEYFFKESQRAASVGSYRCDLVGGMWESSEVLDTIFGIDREYRHSIQGWLDIIHPADRQMMDQYLKEEILFKGNPFLKEYRIVRKNDGKTRWVLGLGNVTLDSNNGVFLLTGTIQDITERKKAELSLQQERDLSMDILNAQPAGIYRVRITATVTLHQYQAKCRLNRRQ